MVIFFRPVKSVYFNQFFCFLCIQAVSDVGPYQTIMLKKFTKKCWTSRACRLDVKRQSLCGSGFSLSAVCMFIDQQHCDNKDGVHFFTLTFECHNRYKLCNSANGDTARRNKNNSEWGLGDFSKKKFCFFSKNPD